tara:strand:- start:188 stop:439 length:252 start_codon:yes stop_codon:yes gene_type:complete
MPAVEMTCLQSLADLEQLEGPCMEALSDGDPEGVATVIRLGLSHLAMTAKRLTDAMVLDRLDADDLGTFNPTNQPGLQSAAEA